MSPRYPVKREMLIVHVLSLSC